jgi:hypothetical protein
VVQGTGLRRRIAEGAAEKRIKEEEGRVEGGEGGKVTVGGGSFSRVEPVQVVDKVHWDTETGKPFTMDAAGNKTWKT